MHDLNSDGVYEITVKINPGTYQYKFVVDGAYFPDPDNPVFDGSQYQNSQIVITDPMITYLLPFDTNSVTLSTLPHIKAIFAFNPPADTTFPVVTLAINGHNINSLSTYYSAASKTLDYPLDTNYMKTGSNTVVVNLSMSIGNFKSKTTTINLAADPRFDLLTEDMIYKKANIMVYGKVYTKKVANIALSLNGNPYSTMPDTNGNFAFPVTLTMDTNVAIVTVYSQYGVGSKTQKLIYLPDNQPVIGLSNSLNGRTVSSTAAATSPAGLALTYSWFQDPGNPEQVTLQNITSPGIQITIPSTKGEYIFKVKVSDSKGKYSYAGFIARAESDSVHIEGPDEHPGWVDSLVLYEIYTPSYGPTSSISGLKGLLAKLDDLSALGINAVWLTPIFDGNYNGYAEKNYYKISSALGTEDDLRQVVQKAHQKGIKILLDLVINHTWIQHPFFQNVLALKGNSPFANYYLWSGVPGSSGFSYYYNWTDLPNMNVNNPELEEYLYNVAAYWIREFDVDGYRCDVAWGIDARNHTFWQEMRRRIKLLKPEAFLLAESPADNNLGGYVTGLDIYNHKFDAAYDWELRGFGVGALNDLFTKVSANVSTLSNVITKSYPINDYPMRFVENHDFLRASVEFGVNQSKLAHTLVFTVGGIPLVYGGGEVGELTQLNPITWTDPNKFKPYFTKLINIRKKFIRNNSLVNILSNSAPLLVESYLTKSDTNKILTVANFNNAPATFTINFTGSINDSALYVYDLFADTSLHVSAFQINSVTFKLSGYEARVYSLQKYITTSVTGNENTVYQYQLEQNYPNPFNPSTIITYSLRQTGNVKVTVFDLLGREVAILVNQTQNSGIYKVTWDGKNSSGESASSGIYFYSINSGSFVSTKKMILLK
jgi:glycosidase